MALDGPPIVGRYVWSAEPERHLADWADVEDYRHVDYAEVTHNGNTWWTCTAVDREPCNGRKWVEFRIRCHLTTVVDPYAGMGRRLGGICDVHGWRFVGIDIEVWPDADARVKLGDAARRKHYPRKPFAVVTSPPYFGNRISSDYVNGPTPTTKVAGRRSYGVSLGRPLDERNLARSCRPTQAHAERFYGELTKAACLWPSLALLNVDLPMCDAAGVALACAGFTIDNILEVETPRYRGGAGSDKRAPHELIMVATR